MPIPLVAKGTAPLVTLRGPAGEWLNLDGTAVTTIKDHCYRGTVEQAKKMRNRSEHAKGFRMEHFTKGVTP